MNVPALEDQIRQADAALQQARERAEHAAHDVRTQAMVFVEEWVRAAVTNEVTNKPEVSKALGLEGLRKLKQELADVCARLPTFVEEDLGADSLWPHRAERIDRTKSYRMNGNRPPDALGEAIRNLLGYAGELIVRHGFEKPGQNASWENRAGRWRYRYGYDWSKPLKAAMEAYGEAYERVKTAAEACETARDAKEKAEASDLWNRA